MSVLYESATAGLVYIVSYLLDPSPWLWETTSGMDYHNVDSVLETVSQDSMSLITRFYSPVRISYMQFSSPSLWCRAVWFGASTTTRGVSRHLLPCGRGEGRIAAPCSHYHQIGSLVSISLLPSYTLRVTDIRSCYAGSDSDIKVHSSHLLPFRIYSTRPLCSSRWVSAGCSGFWLKL